MMIYTDKHYNSLVLQKKKKKAAREASLLKRQRKLVSFFVPERASGSTSQTFAQAGLIIFSSNFLAITRKKKRVNVISTLAKV